MVSFNECVESVKWSRKGQRPKNFSINAMPIYTGLEHEHRNACVCTRLEGFRIQV